MWAWSGESINRKKLINKNSSLRIAKGWELTNLVEGFNKNRSHREKRGVILSDSSNGLDEITLKNH